MKIKHYVLSVLLAAGLAGPSFANPVLTDLTAADYITVGTLDWAWAGPITSQFYEQNILSQAGLHQGWREATDFEWASRPNYTAFGNKCASQYWNTFYTHCDFGDTLSQHWDSGSNDSADLWYVRSEADPGQVPEPGSLALAAAALLTLLAGRKKKAQ